MIEVLNQFSALGHLTKTTTR